MSKLDKDLDDAKADAIGGLIWMAFLCVAFLVLHFCCR